MLSIRKILIFLFLAGIPSFAQNTAPQKSSQSGQAARLQQAEKLADSVIDRLHKTLDFEPIVSDLFTTDAVQSLQKQAPNIDRRDLLRVYAAGLTFLYLSSLLHASLEMNGTTEDDLPPDIKIEAAELEKFERNLSSNNTQDLPQKLQNFIKRAETTRLTIVKYIRPDVWTSEPYKNFLKQYPDQSRTESGDGEETTYIISREAVMFHIVERNGVMKIAGVSPAWID